MNMVMLAALVSLGFEQPVPPTPPIYIAADLGLSPAVIAACGGTSSDATAILSALSQEAELRALYAQAQHDLAAALRQADACMEILSVSPFEADARASLATVQSHAELARQQLEEIRIDLIEAVGTALPPHSLSVASPETLHRVHLAPVAYRRSQWALENLRTIWAAQGEHMVAQRRGGEPASAFAAVLAQVESDSAVIAAETAVGLNKAAIEAAFRDAATGTTGEE